MLRSSVNVEKYFKIFQIEGRSKTWIGRGNARSILELWTKEIGKRLHKLQHQVQQTNNTHELDGFFFWGGGHNHSKHSCRLPSARAR
jgi:hypothetical protein